MTTNAAAFKGLVHRNKGSKFPLVIAMYTAGRTAHALRLKHSLSHLGLSFSICEVDAIHSSTSISGNPESALPKPAFIKTWLLKHGKPVLYVDADMVFVSFPTVIFQAYRQGTQFATYNWLSAEENQTFIPEQNPSLHPGHTLISVGDQTYKKGFSVDHVSTEQIIVSGAVQYWGTSPEALNLLDSWLSVIQANPRSRDDHCLDYAFNNFPERAKLAFFSLPRAYCRVGWWPHITPVIDHPGLPALNMPWQPLAPEYLAKRVHPHLLRPRNPTPQSSNWPSA